MTAERYRRWSAPFRGRRARLIPTADRALTAVVFAAYPALLLGQGVRTGAFPWREAGVPAASLVLVTLLRALIDRPRPYERLDIEPLIRRETRGKSFPSRHVFSVFVIAVTGWTVHPAIGAALAVAGVGLMVTRVLGGVHYPSDVLAGAALGVLLGAAGYRWLP